MTPETALALATVAHAGFQVTVTAMVYPALLSVVPDQWDQAHHQHSRRIVPLVGIVYLVLVAAGAWRVSHGPDVAAWVTLGLVAGALVVTAVLAAPIHGRLDAGSSDLRRRLVVVDRIRCGFAVAAALTAVAALS